MVNICNALLKLYTVMSDNSHTLSLMYGSSSAIDLVPDATNFIVWSWTYKYIQHNNQNYMNKI